MPGLPCRKMGKEEFFAFMFEVSIRALRRNATIAAPAARSPPPRPPAHLWAAAHKTTMPLLVSVTMPRPCLPPFVSPHHGSSAVRGRCFSPLFRTSPSTPRSSPRPGSTTSATCRSRCAPPVRELRSKQAAARRERDHCLRPRRPLLRCCLRALSWLLAVAPARWVR